MLHLYVALRVTVESDFADTQNMDTSIIRMICMILYELTSEIRTPLQTGLEVPNSSNVQMIAVHLIYHSIVCSYMYGDVCCSYMYGVYACGVMSLRQPTAGGKGHMYDTQVHTQHLHPLCIIKTCGLL